jgi:hypothetical protein
MQTLLKRILVLKIVGLIFASMVMVFICESQGNPSGTFGSILINLNNSDEFIEFKVQNGNLVKTIGGKTTFFEKEGRTHSICMSDNFKNIFNSERLYHYKEEERLEAILSQYDLEKLENLRSTFIRNKGNLEGGRYFLTGPGKKFQHFWAPYAYFFIPNRQFSHVIYYDYSFAGVLIDLTSKEISFPFGLDDLEHVVWNKEGQYVAYSLKRKWSRSTLLIRDIKGRIVLKKDIDKNVSDIAWAPESTYVALLTWKGRTGLLPWELLFALSGHPTVYSTFYLEVYDMGGDTLYTDKVKSNFKNSSGYIVWSP